MNANTQDRKHSKRKKRAPGTDAPPRQSFTLRLEASTVERLDDALRGFKGSRNEYIERLIELDLQYRERMV